MKQALPTDCRTQVRRPFRMRALPQSSCTTKSSCSQDLNRPVQEPPLNRVPVCLTGLHADSAVNHKPYEPQTYFIHPPHIRAPSVDPERLRVWGKAPTAPSPACRVRPRPGKADAHFARSPTKSRPISRPYKGYTYKCGICVYVRVYVYLILFTYIHMFMHS